MSILSFLTKPITNVVDHYKNHTIVGKMIQGKSFGDALKETVSEKTVIGRMTTKGENIFEAIHHTVCANDVASASIFGDPDAK